MVDLLIVLALAGMFFAIPFLFGYAGMRIIGGSNAFNLGIIAATATMFGWMLWSRWALFIGFAVALLFAWGEWNERRRDGVDRLALVSANDPVEGEDGDDDEEGLTP
jgi:hypothetical protein